MLNVSLISALWADVVDMAVMAMGNGALAVAGLAVAALWVAGANQDIVLQAAQKAAAGWQQPPLSLRKEARSGYSARAMAKARKRLAKGLQRPTAPIMSYLD